MFNRTKVVIESNPITRVIEKSVSPDKITDVYKDVKAEIDKTLLRTFTIKSTHLDGVVMEFENRYDTVTKILHMRFVLNGNEHIGKTEVQDFLSEEQVYKELVDFFTFEVTKILMKDAYKIVKRN